MSYRKVFAFGFLYVALVQPSRAQSGLVSDAQRRAVEVIERAIEAVGGDDALDRLQTVETDFGLEQITVGQAMAPGAESASTSGGVGRIVITTDFLHDRRLISVFASDTASAPVSRAAQTGDELFVLVLASNTVSSVDPAFAHTFFRQLPFGPAMLLDVRERLGHVRWLGREEYAGQQHDVVSYADRHGNQIAMFFDMGTGRLSKAEYVESHPQFGDHVLELRFGDYRPVGTFEVPHRIESFIGDLKISGARLNAVNAHATIDEDLLKRPAAATEGPMVTQAASRPADIEVDELGEGVFYIENAGSGYNVMFVDTPRGVVVLEPPLSPEVSRAVIAKVGETLPGRPIVGVLMTHYHWDHSGGLRPYLDHGAMVITTPGNEEFVKMVAGAERSLDGRWAEAAKEPRFALVEGHRSFGDGATRIEVYDVGPSPHVEEILVAYLPGPKVLFVGDLYSFSGQVSPASAWAVALAEKIDELGLDVETVVPVHGVKTTMDNFREGVRLAQSGS